MLKTVFKALLAFTLTALSATVFAQLQFDKPEDAIKYRQAAFTVLGTHFSHLGDVAQGKIPFDAEQVAQEAEILDVIAHLPFQGFGEGTDKGAKTGAKPNVWTEVEKFDGVHEKMLIAVTDGLVPAARSGDLGQLKKAFGPAARSCKACHDDFRAK